MAHVVIFNQINLHTPHHRHPDHTGSTIPHITDTPTLLAVPIQHITDTPTLLAVPIPHITDTLTLLAVPIPSNQEEWCKRVDEGGGSLIKSIMSQAIVYIVDTIDIFIRATNTLSSKLDLQRQLIINTIS